MQLAHIQAKIKNRTAAALAKIGVTSDKAVFEFSKDVESMAKALLRDKTGRGIKRRRKAASTGKLESTIQVRHKGNLSSSVSTGTHYGAPQEWGWTPKGRKRSFKGKSAGTIKRVRGKKFIVRATFGMIARWKRGERWK